MADSNRPFGFGPEDFDKFAREAQDGLREVLGKMFEGQPGPGAWSTFFDDGRTRTRVRPEPETTGETGSGVWAILVVDAEGGARVEEVYAGELEALRANKNNTDSRRKVRFLPYGIAVSALDEGERTEAAQGETDGDGPTEPTAGDAPAAD